MRPSSTNASAAIGWVSAATSRATAAACRTAASAVNRAGTQKARAAVTTPSPIPAIRPSRRQRRPTRCAPPRSPAPRDELTYTWAGTASASSASASRNQTRIAICWPPSATGPSRAAIAVVVSGTTPSAIVRTESWCPSRSRAVTSARPGRRGLTAARREAAPYHAAAAAWAVTVPQAEPSRPRCTPYTRKISSTTFSTLAPTAMRSGVRASASPTRWPFPA